MKTHYTLHDLNSRALWLEIVDLKELSTRIDLGKAITHYNNMEDKPQVDSFFEDVTQDPDYLKGLLEIFNSQIGENNWDSGHVMIGVNTIHLEVIVRRTVFESSYTKLKAYLEKHGLADVILLDKPAKETSSDGLLPDWDDENEAGPDRIN